MSESTRSATATPVLRAASARQVRDGCEAVRLALAPSDSGQKLRARRAQCRVQSAGDGANPDGLGRFDHRHDGIVRAGLLRFFQQCIEDLRRLHRGGALESPQAFVKVDQTPLKVHGREYTGDFFSQPTGGGLVPPPPSCTTNLGDTVPTRPAGEADLRGLALRFMKAEGRVLAHLGRRGRRIGGSPGDAPRGA